MYTHKHSPTTEGNCSRSTPHCSHVRPNERARTPSSTTTCCDSGLMMFARSANGSYVYLDFGSTCLALFPYMKPANEFSILSTQPPVTSVIYSTRISTTRCVSITALDSLLLSFLKTHSTRRRRHSSTSSSASSSSSPFPQRTERVRHVTCSLASTYYKFITCLKIRSLRSSIP